jgi:glucokinase
MAKNKGRQLWVGFDLGGTKMLATVYDSKFRLLGKERRRTRGYEGAEQGVARIVETIQAALVKAEISAADLSGIGVGSPGPLDPDAGVLLDLPNLGWKKVPLKASLEKTFGCSVRVANDVDAGTYGEYCFGAGKGARCVLGVFPGTGVGGGCVYEGNILNGRGISALEIGHCRVLPDGRRCGCGNRGCLETVASRLAISSNAAAAAYRGEAPHLLAATGMDLSRMRSGAIAESIKQGDVAIEQIVRDAARWLGLGISYVVNLLVPDVVVLGGGLVAAMPEIYRAEVTAAAMEYAMPPFRKSFRVTIAELGDYATAMGAAAWARQRIEPAANRNE